MGKRAFQVNVAVSATAGLSAALGLLGSTENLQAGVTPGDTFSIAIVGFNGTTSTASGAYLTTPTTFDPVFGSTNTYPGDALGGQTLTITSSETVGATNTVDTITMSVPTNFAPTGTKIGTRYVADIEVDIGEFNATIPGGTTYDTLDFSVPPVAPTANGNITYSGGSFALTGFLTASNGGASLAGDEGVSSGTGATQASSLEPLNINSFTFNITYPNAAVPEPSSIGILGAVGIGAGGLGLINRRRRRRSA